MKSSESNETRREDKKRSKKEQEFARGNPPVAKNSINLYLRQFYLPAAAK